MLNKWRDVCLRIIMPGGTTAAAQTDLKINLQRRRKLSLSTAAAAVCWCLVELLLNSGRYGADNFLETAMGGYGTIFLFISIRAIDGTPFKLLFSFNSTILFFRILLSERCGGPISIPYNKAQLLRQWLLCD